VKRFVTIVGVVLVVAVVVGFLTFPTDAIVRAVLDRAPLPDRMQLQFAGASLRPNGLRLDDVHILREDGDAAFDAVSLRLRPSLWGLWQDRTGRPWTIAAETCQGTIELTIDATPVGTSVKASLQHVELATLLPYVFRQIEAYGRVDGPFEILLGDAGVTATSGALELRGASWTPGGFLEDTPLRADTGNLAWKFENARLELTKIEAASKDFQATGSGLVRFVNPIDDSPLDIRLEVTPGETMPPLLRRYFDAFQGSAPTTQGTRTFRLQGQLRDPRLVGPPGRG
jgi:type II secretion system protein N